MTLCASSRSPRAAMRGSVLRTRPLPNREVSPPSPVRVVTRADARFRAGTRESIRAIRAMLATVRNASTRTGGTRMPTGRGEAKDKKAKKKPKDQLEKELKRRTVSAPIQPLPVELVPRKRKEKDWQRSQRVTDTAPVLQQAGAVVRFGSQGVRTE